MILVVMFFYLLSCITNSDHFHHIKDNTFVSVFEKLRFSPRGDFDNGGDVYYISYNQIGSPRAITDENGNILKTLTYDSFGTIIADINPSFKIPFGFAGGLYDSDTKLTRFGYRDYDASTGKWTAKDPIGFDAGDTNLYGYVLGDPVNFVDPSGLVDLNLFKPYSYAYYLAKQHGLFHIEYTIGGHGTPLYDQRFSQGRDFSPADLMKIMKENGYTKGPVSVLSCNTGTSYDGESSYAQRLSRELGVYSICTNILLQLWITWKLLY